MDSDAMLKLAEESTNAVGVLGKAGEFALVPLGEPGPLPVPVLLEAVRRGYHFCGCLGVRQGRPEGESERDPDSIYTMLRASLVFAVRVADKINGGDCWLEHLYRLPDPRD